MRTFWSGLVAAGTLMLSLAANAADSVVLVNETTIAAAGGFPYVISQPGNYRLSENLVVPSTARAGISVATNNVTIDLNGFAITPEVRLTNDGIFLPGCHTGITIRNGLINGFVYGIYEMSAGVMPSCHTGDIIRDLHVSQNQYGIYINGAVIHDSTITGNSAAGIVAWWSTIDSNIISDSQDGILSRGNTIVRNNISNNTGYGIAAVSFEGVGTISGNSFTSNTREWSDGISANDNACNLQRC